LKLSFLKILVFLIFTEHHFSRTIDGRLKYSKYVSNDIFEYKFNNVFNPYIIRPLSTSESLFSVNISNSIILKDSKPEINASFQIKGGTEDFYFYIEPILINSHYSKINLGTTYSRNNISGRFENAFISYKYNGTYFVFGRFPLWWGQSNQSSIIQNEFCPSYDSFLLRYKSKQYLYEIFSGQLNSSYDNEGYRIKRNIGGHRLVWKPNMSLIISIGEQIIYTGRNRPIELIYLNPFIPYFFNSIENNEENFPFDNDNSMILGEFRYLPRKNFSIYGEFIIDDYQIDDTNIDDGTGYKIGVDGKLSKKLIYIFELTKIKPQTYIHHGQFTSWEQNYHPLGFKYGPDVKCLHFKTIYEIKNYNILLDINFLEKGVNNIFSKWNNLLNIDSNSLKRYTLYNIAISRNFKPFKIELGWKSNSFNLDPTVEYLSSNTDVSYYLKISSHINKKISFFADNH